MADNLESSDPFRSKRLIYRSAENNDRDKKFFASIQKDPSHMVYSTGNLLRPVNRETTDEHFKDFLKNVLAVFICLPKPVVEENAKQEQGQAMTKEIATTTVEPKSQVSKDSKAVEEEDDGLTPIGFLSFQGGSSGQFDYDHHHRSLWMVISIAKPYRGNGIGREAVNWALDWAFQYAGMHSVGLGCYEFNERGRHLYESLGFVQSGAFRKDLYYNRKWWDVLIYSMLEEEWEALRDAKKTVVESVIV